MTIPHVIALFAALFVGLIIGMVIAGHVSNRELFRAWEAGRERGRADGGQLMDQMQRRINRLESASKRVHLYGEAAK